MYSLPGPVPIVAAPMAGGPSTPALAVAVAEAGGLGFVAGGYLSAEALRDVLAATRALTGAPLGVNVFVPSTPADPAVVTAYAERLQGEAARLGVALGAGAWEDDHYAAKLDVAAAAHAHLVTFTFGVPSIEEVESLHRAGCAVGVTVTRADEASRAESIGADVLIVQGAEAGGHQGRFADDEPNELPLAEALADIRDASGLPFFAAGAIMGPAEFRAALAGGALAAQLGTALLCTPEAGTSAVYRRALTERLFADTIVTRAYSGHFARGLANRFAREHPDAPAAYPEVHHLTRPLRAAATAAGDPEVPNLWAGTGWGRIVAEPAAAVIRRIAK